MFNLTEIEQRALDSEVNLADGHPRQDPTPGQQAVIASFAELFHEATRRPFAEVERLSQEAFFTSLVQVMAPIGQRRVFSVYSSSVAMVAVANVLGELSGTVALLHPTFDNIPDILRRVARLTPVSESQCASGDPDAFLDAETSVLFITSPNNPTGWVLEPERLALLAGTCADRGLVLCIDASFRGFDVRAQCDTYEILEASGVNYVVIEDTGKLWPLAELKLGFVAVSDSLRQRVEHALSDILLSVSPFVLKIVEEMSADAVTGGFAALHELIATNRSAVMATVDAMRGVSIADPDSRISVCRITFDSASEAAKVERGLLAAGIHVLPCSQFHWARPEEGASSIRLALSRNLVTVSRALGVLSRLDITPSLLGEV